MHQMINISLNTELNIQILGYLILLPIIFYYGIVHFGFWFLLVLLPMILFTVAFIMIVRKDGV